MSQFKENNAFVTRWLRFPLEGRYKQLHGRLKRYAYEEGIRRKIKFTMQDAMIELMDEGLNQKGYRDGTDGNEKG